MLKNRDIKVRDKDGKVREKMKFCQKLKYTIQLSWNGRIKYSVRPNLNLTFYF